MMLRAAAVPGLLLFEVSLFAPDSPRWLMKMSQRDNAETEIYKIQHGVTAKLRLEEIQAELDTEGAAASWGTVSRRKWRPPLLIGVGAAVFQQITGIKAMIYYADQILAAAGFISQSAQTAVTTWAISGVNVLLTFFTTGFLDRIGRRKLLLAELIGMGASLIEVGVAFKLIGVIPDKQTLPSTAGLVTLVAPVCLIISFALPMGPVVWKVINKIISALSWIWISFAVPDTKGKSPQDIQVFWTVKQS